MLVAFRSQIVGASGLRATARCATAAIKLAFSGDPALEVFSRLLTALMRWEFDPTGDRAQLRVAWRATYARVVRGNDVSFRHVVGPVSALIASLYTIGWTADVLENWADPTGVRWLVDPSTLGALR